MRRSLVALAVVLVAFVVICSRDRVPPSLSIPSPLTVSSILFEDYADNSNVRVELVIQGSEYFQIQNSDGSLTYTRNGEFHFDNVGGLCDSTGNRVYPLIAIPIDTINLGIDQNGQVTVVTYADPKMKVIVANFGVVRFPNANGLKLVGRQTYQATPESGAPTVSELGTEGSGFLITKCIEINDEWLERMHEIFDRDPQTAKTERIELSLPPLPMGFPEHIAAEPTPVIVDASTVVAADAEASQAKRLYGWGLVVGLKGTGGRAAGTRQELQRLMNALSLTTGQAGPSVEEVFPHESASMVLVSATIPAGAKKGGRVDVAVSISDDATSLEGGTLLLTSLRGQDGETYALATGKIVLRKGEHDRVQLDNAEIPTGAIIERQPLP